MNYDVIPRSWSIPTPGSRRRRQDRGQAEGRGRRLARPAIPVQRQCASEDRRREGRLREDHRRCEDRPCSAAHHRAGSRDADHGVVAVAMEFGASSGTSPAPAMPIDAAGRRCVRRRSGSKTASCRCDGRFRPPRRPRTAGSRRALQARRPRDAALAAARRARAPRPSLRLRPRKPSSSPSPPAGSSASPRSTSPSTFCTACSSMRTGRAGRRARVA